MNREGRPIRAALESPAKATDPILPAAVRYANAGLRVFPCVPGAKVPLAPNGFHSANTNEGVIRSWWARWPDANIALATAGPGFDVLDVDLRPSGSGAKAFKALRTLGLLAGVMGVVRTLELVATATGGGRRVYSRAHVTREAAMADGMQAVAGRRDFSVTRRNIDASELAGEPRSTGRPASRNEGSPEDAQPAEHEADGPS